ncbi:AraC family transcriptional regulator [Xanthomonas hortorum pv. vitians]|uniref:AraC family transcriptional regulator n=1 Tax=Xanthomonas hortorum TaxID=56454 RepID=UPI0032E8CC09
MLQCDSLARMQQDESTRGTQLPLQGGQGFWRDAALPFVELRQVINSRTLCYAAHTHEQWSVGTVDRGLARYRNGRVRAQVGAQSLTLINPGDVHACNPDPQQDWSFRMLYLNVAWLREQQRALGLAGNADVHMLAAPLCQTPAAYAAFDRMHALLIDDNADALARESALIAFVARLHLHVEPMSRAVAVDTGPMRQVAEYLQTHHARAVSLRELCTLAGMPAPRLIRGFRQAHGLTPHAYLLDCRFQRAREALRRGGGIAEVAYAHGYADQAHLQRSFKRAWAVTPGHSRSAGPHALSRSPSADRRR